MADDARITSLRERADRADELAETADLMGDAATADRLRARAADCRLVAMDLLDE